MGGFRESSRAGRDSREDVAATHSLTAASEKNAREKKKKRNNTPARPQGAQSGFTSYGRQSTPRKSFRMRPRLATEPRREPCLEARTGFLSTPGASSKAWPPVRVLRICASTAMRYSVHCLRGVAHLTDGTSRSFAFPPSSATRPRLPFLLCCRRNGCREFGNPSGPTEPTPA